MDYTPLKHVNNYQLDQVTWQGAMIEVGISRVERKAYPILPVPYHEGNLRTLWDILRETVSTYFSRPGSWYLSRSFSSERRNLKKLMPRYLHVW